jgi:hypothetical protein
MSHITDAPSPGADLAVPIRITAKLLALAHGIRLPYDKEAAVLADLGRQCPNLGLPITDYDRMHLLRRAGMPHDTYETGSKTILGVLGYLDGPWPIERRVDDDGVAVHPSSAHGNESRVKPQMLALMILAENPKLSMTDIAKQVGVSRQTLYKPKWKGFRKRFKEMRPTSSGHDTQHLPRGHKAKDGSIEAYDDDDN